MKKTLCYVIPAIIGACALGPVGLIIAVALVWLIRKSS